MILTMRIESIKAEPDRGGRFWIMLEDGSRIPLYRQTIEEFGLYAGKDLTDEQWAQLQSSASAMSAKMRAVRIVAASAVSKKDLQHRLVQKGEDPQQAAQAVAWMEELRLVDDAETARQVVSRCIAKGYGVQRAKQALFEKKIPKQYWEDVLADYPDQTQHLQDFLRARLDSHSDQKEVKRTIDALLRRGHSYSQIRLALQRLQMDPDEFPEE